MLLLAVMDSDRLAHDTTRIDAATVEPGATAICSACCARGVEAGTVLKLELVGVQRLLRH